MDSPALSVTSDFSDFTDEELDKYFANYVPLSNLPTPPPAKEPVVDAGLPWPPAPGVHGQSPELEVYSTHLANLVPANVSAQRPSVPVICGFLERANLPSEMIAFTACILDALSQRFACSWRDAGLPAKSSNSNFFSMTSSRQQAITNPDVIVLAALALAHGFLDDRGRLTSHWAKIEGSSQFTVQEIEATKMHILQDIDYGLFKITEEMVQQMMQHMQRASNFFPSIVSLSRKDSVATDKEERRPRLSLSMQGTAVWHNGMQTPEPSP